MKSNTLNWPEVRQRVARSEALLEKTMRADKERVAAAYRRRAVRLASVDRGTSGRTEGVPVLVFQVAAEPCGLELAVLAEILPFTGCTPFPSSAAPLLGAFSHRGEIRLLVDLAALLGIFPEENPVKSYILLPRRNDCCFGLKVGQINDIRQIRPEYIAVPGSQESNLPSRYLKSFMRDRLRLLDGAAVFSPGLIKEVP